jgi:hypothetical protein
MTEEPKPWLRELARRKRQERRDRFAHEYGERCVAVLDALIQSDPGGLVAAGAPPVQYTTEAGPICRRLRGAKTLEDARRAVREVLRDYFPDARAPDYEELAGAIWRAWERGEDAEQ